VGAAMDARKVDLERGPRNPKQSAGDLDALRPCIDIPGFAAPRTYAAWPVWADSTRQEVRFTPQPKKHVLKYWRQLQEWNAQTREPGCHGGGIGLTAMTVLECLIFKFHNWKSGRLDPSYDALQKATGLCRQAVADALAKLKALGVINWLRRCVAEFVDGRFTLSQDSNAYGVLPPSQWLGFVDPEPPAPPPHPTAWGAAPPLATAIEDAATLTDERASPTAVLRALESDPTDELAVALGRLMRARQGSLGSQT